MFQIRNFFSDIYVGATVSELDQQQLMAGRLEYVQQHLYPMRLDRWI